jgi:hypothetical protein
MLFIETSIFTKQIKDLVTDEEYHQLQQDLLVLRGSSKTRLAVSKETSCFF